jgi:predicted nucleotidyltransferase
MTKRKTVIPVKTGIHACPREGGEQNHRCSIRTAKRIEEQYRPKKIILFGSYAYGEPTQDSDVDLLIIKNTDKRPLVD